MNRMYSSRLRHCLVYSPWYLHVVGSYLWQYRHWRSQPTAILLQCLPILSTLTFRTVPTGSRMLPIQTNGDASSSSRYTPGSVQLCTSTGSPKVRVPRLLQHLVLEYSVDDSSDQHVCDK